MEQHLSTADAAIDYCLIGHVCRDVVPGGYTVGGTVAYASRVAQALGRRTGVVTRCAPDFDVESGLPGSQVALRPSAETTTFHNVYTPAGRVQRLHGWAGRIRAADVPADWRRAPTIHVAPLANEIAFDVLKDVPAVNGPFIGLTPQGWMRRWTEEGDVYTVDFDGGAAILHRADAVILSDEDLPDDAALAYFRRHCGLLIMTMGHNGCTLFQDESVVQVPAPAVSECELTGAGDIFATAFFIRFQASGRQREAAEFANHIAANAVTQPDLEKKVALIERLQAERHDLL